MIYCTQIARSRWTNVGPTTMQQLCICWPNGVLSVGPTLGNHCHRWAIIGLSTARRMCRPCSDCTHRLWADVGKCSTFLSASVPPLGQWTKSRWTNEILPMSGRQRCAIWVQYRVHVLVQQQAYF